jgi:glycosyltransferase involved in cell wall biosynthesis
MKSICILVQNYYEIDIRVRRKAEALVAAGYIVDVLALASSFKKEKNYTLNGVNVQTLNLGKKRGSLLRYAYEYAAFFFWCFFKLFCLMSYRKYGIIDVNNLPDFLVFAGVYARLRGAKIVFDMHEITPEFYISKYKMSERSLVIRVLKWIEWASFSFADHVITINEPIRKLLVERGLDSSKTSVIMNSVDEALFKQCQPAASEPFASTDGNKFIMMYHGTLTSIYGLDIAIQAFGRVHKLMGNAEFWILGGGTEKAGLEALSKKLGLDRKVKFVGNVLPDEVPNWLRRCAVGVLATRRDVFLDFSFSNKLSEYIIMGKAVISSRLKAIRHYFSENAFAFFEPNDPSDLCKQMLQLYSDPELRLQLAAKARQEYAPMRWELMKQAYLSIIARTGWETEEAPCAATTIAATR